MARKRKKPLTKGQRVVRRIIRIVIVVAACFAALLIYWKFFKQDTATDDTSYYMAGPSYESAVVTDLEETYAANGRIQSGSQAAAGSGTGSSKQQSGTGTASQSSGTQAATATEDTGSYPVKEVYVSVGDTVRKGDPLYSLDMSDLESEISLNQKKLALQQESDAIDNAAAERALKNAQEASVQQYEDSTRKLNEATSDANTAIVDAFTGNQDIAQYQQELADAQAAYDSAKAEYDRLVLQQSQIETQLNAINAQISTDTAQLAVTGNTYGTESEEYKAASDAIAEETVTQTQYANAKTAIDTQVTDANTKLTEADTALTTAKTNLSNAQSTLTTSDGSIQTQQRSLEDQQSSIIAQNRTTKEAEDAARDAIAKNEIAQKSNALDTQEQIRKDQEKLQGAVIRASMDGTVTGVNVVPGQIFSGTDAIVINDLETMKVGLEIEEGHIADLAVGQRTYVKTDSTGDQNLDGTVSYTAITPTESQTSSGTGTQAATTSQSKASYHVEVTLNSPNDRLRMGMSANVSFILASSYGCIAVPNAAIQTDADGNTYVNVVDESAGESTESTDSAEEAGTGETEDAASSQAEDAGTLETEEAVQTEADSRTFLQKISDLLDRITGKETQTDTQDMTVTYPTRTVYVTTGISSDYYTEITSGDIQEGDMVEEPSGSSGSDAGLLEGLY